MVDFKNVKNVLKLKNIQSAYKRVVKRFYLVKPVSRKLDKCVLLCIKWCSKGVIYFEIVPEGNKINSEVYANQLQDKIRRPSFTVHFQKVSYFYRIKVDHIYLQLIKKYCSSSNSQF